MMKQRAFCTTGIKFLNSFYKELELTVIVPFMSKTFESRSYLIHHEQFDYIIYYENIVEQTR
jgi:hypothetical protein